MHIAGIADVTFRSLCCGLIEASFPNGCNPQSETTFRSLCCGLIEAVTCSQAIERGAFDVPQLMLRPH